MQLFYSPFANIAYNCTGDSFQISQGLNILRIHETTFYKKKKKKKKSSIYFLKAFQEMCIKLQDDCTFYQYDIFLSSIICQ